MKKFHPKPTGLDRFKIFARYVVMRFADGKEAYYNRLTPKGSPAWNGSLFHIWDTRECTWVH